MRPGRGAEAWAPARERQIVTLARNVSTRYLAIAVEIAIGLVLLPLNLAYLGQAGYGLWMLIGSVTIHFSLLDLGYGGAIVKFIAQYRAHQDARALNEIASTLFMIFAAIGLLAYGATAAVAFNLEHLFALQPGQAETGRWIALIIGGYVALNFPFSVYGGVMSGFQRYDANNAVAIVTSLTTAAVNGAVIVAGGSLVALVAGTTAVRVLAFLAYRMNAYRVFPELRISPSLFRRDRLREVTGFSIYSSIIDWSNKLNYQLDEIVIGVFLGSPAVAVWAVAERIIAGTQRLTNQLNGVMFPVVVDSDASQRQDTLRQILLQGTRLSLAMVVPISAVLILLADPLLRAWLGTHATPSILGAVPVIQILAVAVAIRVGNATGNTVLKGAGSHRMLAYVNLATGIVNIALSVALVRDFGLVGVAVGTLVPIALSAAFILYPAACRRVGLPIGRAVADSVVPAVWPALVVIAIGMAASRTLPTGTLLAVVLQAVAGGALYLVLFFAVAIGRHDRALYTEKALELLGRRRVPQETGGRRQETGRSVSLTTVRSANERSA
jgi:O-antigen/teichoic acid export membrane protein